MALFQASDFESDPDEAGIHTDALGRALVTWTAMQLRRPVTVDEAALAFNTTPEIIRAAIDEAMWIDCTKSGVIELDGE